MDAGTGARWLTRAIQTEKYVLDNQLTATYAFSVALTSHMTISATQAQLWAQVHAAFPYPSTSVQAEINRIANKCLEPVLGQSPSMRFDPSTCDVVEVMMDLNDLQRLRCYHSRNTPTSDREPIVVVQIGSPQVVIEGNNRVNLWVAAGVGIPKRALVLRVR